MSRTQTSRPAHLTAARRQHFIEMIMEDRSTRIGSESAGSGDAAGSDLDLAIQSGATRDELARFRAEARVLVAEAERYGLGIESEHQAVIDGLLGRARPDRHLHLQDVATALEDVKERVTDAGVQVALREEAATAAEAAFAAAGYSNVERRLAEDGAVRLVFTHESGRKGVAEVAAPEVEAPDAGSDPAVEVMIDVVDRHDAVPPDAPDADEHCEAAGKDAITVHEQLQQARGLRLGKPQQLIRATRGAPGAHTAAAEPGPVSPSPGRPRSTKKPEQPHRAAEGRA